MAAPFVVPFNNCPNDTIQLTQSGYTVPAGKYARISGTIYSGVLKVNSDAIIGNHSTASLVIQSGSNTVSGGAETTLITAGGNVHGFVIVNCTTSGGSGATFRMRRSGTTCGSTVLSANTAGSFTCFVKTGDTITGQPATGVSTNVDASISGSASLVGNNFSIWVESGDVVSFSDAGVAGVAGLIEEFNQIT
jgi:hypothetical protein